MNIPILQKRKKKQQNNPKKKSPPFQNTVYRKEYICPPLTFAPFPLVVFERI